MTKPLTSAMDAFDAATAPAMKRYQTAVAVAATEPDKRAAWDAYVAETAPAQRAYEAAVRADRVTTCSHCEMLTKMAKHAPMYARAIEAHAKAGHPRASAARS